MNEQIKLQAYIFYGQYAKSIYRDEKTGKGTFILETMQYPLSDKNMISMEVRQDPVTKMNVTWYQVLCNALGCPMPFYEKDTPIKVIGYFDKPSKDFCTELKVQSIEVASNGEMATLRYLCHYVSQTDAVCLVRNYGYDIFALTERPDAPELVQKVTSLSGAEALKFVKDIRRTVAERHLFEFLSPLGIPFPYCLKAVKAYGQLAETYLRQNPFEIGAKIGLGFKMCQAIADAAHVPQADEERIRAAAIETMRQISADGHTYVDAVTYSTRFERIVGKGLLDTKHTLSQIFPYLTGELTTVYTGRGLEVHSVALEKAERRIAYNLIRIAENTPNEAFEPALVHYAEVTCHMTYGNQQRLAFQTMLSGKGIKILTGGPGTGKTTTLKGILTAYLRMHPDGKISLCAPTGRAAQKMSESTGYAASTIHKLIGYRPYGKEVANKNSSNPLDSDLVVVDESSMLDVSLFDMLLDAIKTGATLFVMGDPDQLEAVGPGAILFDMMHVKKDIFSQAHLSDVFRQKGGSPIIENARRINQGSISLIQHPDFQVIRTESPEQSLAIIKQIVTQYHDRSDPFKVQVLSPSRQGVTGVQNLNKELQAVLNPGILPNGRRTKDVVYGQVRYRAGDKVMMMRNNYDDSYGYCNGDIGTVVSVSDGLVRVSVQGREMDITRAMLDELSLSYAMTIHKSQGSDFPIVIVALPKNPDNMLVRNLFYTAITRAKNKVFVISEKGAMETAIRRGKLGLRKTKLKEYLLNMEN